MMNGKTGGFDISPYHNARILEFEVNMPSLREPILQGETAESAVASRYNPDIIGVVDDMMDIIFICNTTSQRGLYKVARRARSRLIQPCGRLSRRAQSFLNALSVKNVTKIAANEAVGVCF